MYYIIATWQRTTDRGVAVQELSDDEVRAARQCGVSVARDIPQRRARTSARWGTEYLLREVIGEYADKTDAYIAAHQFRPQAAKVDRGQVVYGTPIWSLRTLARAVVEDHGYDTPSNGGVQSFAGSGEVKWAGRTWRVQGFGPEGTPEYVSRDGGFLCASDRGERIWF